MAEQTEKRIVPVKEGLFHMPTSPDDRPYLIGSKCRECGLVFWPARVVCPLCVRDDTMDEVHIGQRAKLESFSVVYQAQTGFPAPYLQGTVRLPEGPSVITIFTGVEMSEKALKNGQEMEMVVDKLREDEQGNVIVAWKYRPVEG